MTILIVSVFLLVSLGLALAAYGPEEIHVKKYVRTAAPFLALALMVGAAIHFGEMNTNPLGGKTVQVHPHRATPRPTLPAGSAEVELVPPLVVERPAPVSTPVTHVSHAAPAPVTTTTAPATPPATWGTWDREGNQCEGLPTGCRNTTTTTQPRTGDPVTVDCDGHGNPLTAVAPGQAYVCQY